MNVLFTASTALRSANTEDFPDSRALCEVLLCGTLLDKGLKRFGLVWDRKDAGINLRDFLAKVFTSRDRFILDFSLFMVKEGL